MCVLRCPIWIFNLDILSVGAHAVETRVDLLVKRNNSSNGSIPSLRYVGHQLMLLRQHTELPIVFTTRCIKENGKFPMDDPYLFYRHPRRAVQWELSTLMSNCGCSRTFNSVSRSRRGMVLSSLLFMISLVHGNGHRQDDRDGTLDRG